MKKDYKDLTTRDNGVFGLFDPFFDDFFDFPNFRTPSRKENNFMKKDVKECDKDYKLEIEMPGYDKKDINLSLDNGYLTVSAKKEFSEEEKDEENNYIRRERRFGSCTRSFYVGEVREEEINAKLENGVLNIIIPKEIKKIETKKNIEIK